MKTLAGCLPHKSQHGTFDSSPIFAFAKTAVASNAPELRRYNTRHASDFSTLQKKVKNG